MAAERRLAEQGLRVLATARKDFDPATFDLAADVKLIGPDGKPVTDYTLADQLVASARANRQKVHGHTLLWHNQLGERDLIGAWQEAPSQACRSVRPGAPRQIGPNEEHGEHDKSDGKCHRWGRHP